MITLAPNMFLVQADHELPDMSHAQDLFLDGETTSFDVAVAAKNAYAGHRFCGVAVTRDDDPRHFYIPVRHHFKDGTLYPSQVSEEAFKRWLGDTIPTCKNWANNNVKFDAHFAAEDGAQFTGGLECITTAAKLLDSDRLYRGGYGAKALSAAWLGRDIRDKQDAVKDFLKTIKLPRNRGAQDYGLVPPDTMGIYACEDVATARGLRRYIKEKMPADMSGVWQTENLLTPVLYDIEREGMRVDLLELQIEELKIMTELAMLEERIHRESSTAINPATSDGCYELLVNSMGLPVLALNDDGNPSFDKHALMQYLKHPDVASDPKRVSIVETVQKYRKRNTLLTFFVRPYQEHQVDGLMHPDYNQAVRSGRMSCKRPNAQQLSKEAKKLIHPGDGLAFLSCDYSQIEFRLIAHYIRDVKAIEAYAANAETDFHTWVAEMCGIPRKPAKNVNFAIGYGAGKKKVTTMLAGNMELMSNMGAKISDMIASGKLHESQRKAMFDALCKQRAVEVFNQYHEALPGLGPTTRDCALKVQQRGYVFNAYGRRAHLDSDHAHHAFNRLVQGCAADVMKERTVAVAPRYNSTVRSLGLRLAGSVHDETLFLGNREVTRDPRTIAFVARSLEDTSVKFRVPIRTSAGWSDKTWAAASDDDHSVERDGYGKAKVERELCLV